MSTQHNLFFAVLPDLDATARISALVAKLRRDHGLRGSPVAPECLHVSLHSLGRYDASPPRIIAAGKQAGAAVEASSFQLAFDRVARFNGRERPPVVLTTRDKIAALMDLRRALGGAMEKAGLGRPRQSGFVPHVTLLYGGLDVSEMKVEPVTWAVRELVLVEGLHGQGRHIHIGRWPLRDQASLELTLSLSDRGA